jgi:hypothetical protein
MSGDVRDKKLSSNGASNMAMQLVVPEQRLRNAVKHGWSRLFGAARPRRRRRFSLRRGGRTPAPAFAIDPVALTVLAVNRLGPATLRTVANGRPLTVRVPNARIGEIFRAALAEMQKTRLTDRLIAIAVDDDADAGRVPTRA